MTPDEALKPPVGYRFCTEQELLGELPAGTMSFDKIQPEDGWYLCEDSYAVDNGIFLYAVPATRAPAIERDAEVAAMKRAAEKCAGRLKELIMRGGGQRWHEAKAMFAGELQFFRSELLKDIEAASTAGTDFAERLRRAEEERDALKDMIARSDLKETEGAKAESKFPGDLALVRCGKILVHKEHSGLIQQRTKDLQAHAATARKLHAAESARDALAKRVAELEGGK